MPASAWKRSWPRCGWLPAFCAVCRKASATTSGKKPWTADVSRSTRPRSPPPSRAAIKSQQDNPAKTTVTVARPQTLRIHDRVGGRLPTRRGHTAVVTTQLTAKARWRDVRPVAGSGVAAMPREKCQSGSAGCAQACRRQLGLRRSRSDSCPPAAGPRSLPTGRFPSDQPARSSSAASDYKRSAEARR